MVALFFETYGVFSFFALIVFLAGASAASFRPDLDEDIDEREKLASAEQSGAALPVENLVLDTPSRSARARPVKRSKRLYQTRPHLIYTRKPRTT